MRKENYKVVHISTYFNGGAGRAAYRIHESLLKSGIDSSFLNIEKNGDINSNKIFKATYSSETHQPGFLERQENRIKFRINKHLGIQIKKKKDRENEERQKVNVEFQKVRPFLNCETASLPFSTCNILNNPLTENADIIHLHSVANILDYPSFFESNKKSVVWTFHDMNPFQGLFHYKEDEIRNNEKVKIFDTQIRNIKRNAIEKRHSELVVVAPSKWLLKESNNSEIFKEVKSTYIPYPINTSNFYREKDFDFRKTHKIPDGNLIFLFVAEIAKTSRKGFSLLLEALKKINDISFTLIVLGNSNTLEAEGFDIRMAGSVTDNNILRNYYSSVDAFIVPSREDNLPNVMLESLACGTPVIGFPVGGIKEHIINLRTGVLADEINSESLARAIDKFSKNKQEFVSVEIEKYANETFDESNVASEYMKVYNQVLRKNKSFA